MEKGLQITDRFHWRDAGYVYDNALGLFQVGNGQCCQIENTANIEVHNLVVQFHDFGIINVWEVADTRVVDQHIQAAELLDCGLNQISQVFITTQISGNRQHPFPARYLSALLGNRFDPLLIPSGDHNIAAQFGQMQSCFFTNARTWAYNININ